MSRHRPTTRTALPGLAAAMTAHAAEAQPLWEAGGGVAISWVLGESSERVRVDE